MKTVIVFSGYNQRAVISLVRQMDARKAKYLIVALTTDDTILKTVYKAKVQYVREDNRLDTGVLKQIFDQIRTNLPNTNFVIAPTTEYLNRFLLDNISFFERHGVKIPLVTKDLYYKLSDKKTFSDLCKNYEIQVPKEFSTLMDAEQVGEYVAKPRKYTSATGRIMTPVIVRSESESSEFKKDYVEDMENIYFQEYVGGKSLYLLYYFSKNGRVTKYSQENLIQQPGGKSIIGAIPSVLHGSEESLKYEKMFAEIGYTGLVMVEVKEYKNKYFMIEANPRFWGPSQFLLDSGSKILEEFLLDNGCIEEPYINLTPNKNAKYYWSGGVKGVGDLVFHNYSLEEYKSNIKAWEKWDIYKREDTFKIYYNEKQ
jgi:predicted ATP-grasp superfamily ATP-dependent carboligase